MITAKDMVKKLGKKKFVETVTNSQHGQTGADLERARRWGKGKTCMKICQHGKVTIRDFQPTKACEACDSSTAVTKSRDFQPHFNAGLGCWVESRSEEKRVARSMGLLEAG